MKSKFSIFVIISLLLSCSQFGKDSVLITAHRGASGLALENTGIALLKAIETGADYAEIDVQETRDGMVILLHDSTLKRVAGINKNIWDLDYADLQNVEVGSWFDVNFSEEVNCIFMLN